MFTFSYNTSSLSELKFINGTTDAVEVVNSSADSIVANVLTAVLCLITVGGVGGVGGTTNVLGVLPIVDLVADVQLG